MKKILITFLFACAMLPAMAQITIYHDTVAKSWPKDNLSHILMDSLINNTADTITVNWTKTGETFLSGWTGIGICDKVTCYNFPVTGNHSYTVAPGEKVFMYVDVKAAVNAVDGNNYITLTLNDGVSDKTMTFKFYSWANQIKDLENNNIVSIYPNPASNFIYLSIIDPKVSAVNVVNIIGNKVQHFNFDASTPNPLRVPLDNISKGIYLLQFTDNNGKLLGVKRVTKQ